MWKRATLAVAALLATALPAAAEDAVGDWVGKVKIPSGVELTITTHITRGSGGLEGYAESPDQTVTPLPLAGIGATPETLSFSVPSVGGAFEGAWDAKAKGWAGVFRQGGVDMPLTLVRGAPAPRPVVAGLDGEWSGLLAAPGGDLRLRLGVRTDAGGTLGLFQSPDQSPLQVVAQLSRAGEAVKVELRGIGGFEGRLSPDGRTLEGTWSQAGGSLPLTLKKGDGSRKRPASPHP